MTLASDERESLIKIIGEAAGRVSLFTEKLHTTFDALEQAYEDLEVDLDNLRQHSLVRCGHGHNCDLLRRSGGACNCGHDALVEALEKLGEL